MTTEPTTYTITVTVVRGNENIAWDWPVRADMPVAEALTKIAALMADAPEAYLLA